MAFMQPDRNSFVRGSNASSVHSLINTRPIEMAYEVYFSDGREEADSEWKVVDTQKMM